MCDRKIYLYLESTRLLVILEVNIKKDVKTNRPTLIAREVDILGRIVIPEQKT